ncbi:MAG: ketoacid CoA transferase, partial [Spongiibacteraceae bacterium]
MSTAATDYSLAELMICANAAAYSDDGEVLVTGIGVLQRLAASLAMVTTNPGIMMTDSEAWILSSPNPVGNRPADFVQKNENWMGFSRIFDNVWSGRRHLTGGPTQLDRFGQANISALGGDYQQPKVQMLGARGFPGNSICHANSYMVPMHSSRVFIAKECDVVCTIGYNPDRLPKGYSFDDIDLR